MDSLVAAVFFLGRIQYSMYCKVVWRGIFLGVDSLYFVGRVKPLGPGLVAMVIEGITK